MFGRGFGGLNCEYDTDPQHVEVVIECTLGELYMGTLKTVKYIRRKFNDDKVTTFEQTVSKEFVIKPGYSESTTLVFAGEGHDCKDCPTGDLIIQII